MKEEKEEEGGFRCLRLVLYLLIIFLFTNLVNAYIDINIDNPNAINCSTIATICQTSSCKSVGGTEGFPFPFYQTFDFDVEINSTYDLPIEGQTVETLVKFTPVIFVSTIKPFVFIAYFYNEEGELRFYNYHYISEGCYEAGNTYTTSFSVNFDSPGIWEMKYTLIPEKELPEIINISEMKNVLIRSKKIHVLSFYESKSIINADKSITISIIALIAGFGGFIVSIVALIRTGKKQKLNSYKSKVVVTNQTALNKTREK